MHPISSLSYRERPQCIAFLKIEYKQPKRVSSLQTLCTEGIQYEKHVKCNYKDFIFIIGVSVACKRIDHSAFSVKHQNTQKKKNVTKYYKQKYKQTKEQIQKKIFRN